MRIKTLAAILPFLVLFIMRPSYGEENPRVEIFSPQGAVKGVRQVSVRFSEQMVPFGDPRGLIEPFDINCSEKGAQRWVDGKNWVYDFEKDLPAGIQCVFNLKIGLKTLAGNELKGERTFAFSTGGPAIRSSYPYEGSNHLDEEQIFILTLDAEPTEESLLQNISFSIEGIHERVGIRILSGEEREQILKNRYPKTTQAPLVIIQSKQRFPTDAKVSLIWGKGVMSRSGVATEKDQTLHFKTRRPFTAEFHCQRENPHADCIPIASMSLNFSAPVAWEQAKQIVLKGPDGSKWDAKTVRSEEEEIEGESQQKTKEFVQVIVFSAPLPQKSEFHVELPAGLTDDAGRKLANADKFPLTVQTDEYPPLAKFPARFGILELKAEPVLPVTLRNIEPEVMARLLKIDEGKGIVGKTRGMIESLKGQILKVEAQKGVQKADEVFSWLKKMAGYYEYSDREKSVFSTQEMLLAKKISIPKPNGAKAFEVVGIPLKEPGFYVIELESPILGSSLFGASKPMFVPTAVLVTNLSVHFKWGRESSLVWVTALDSGKPVRDSLVAVRDCKGNVLWDGKTDANGIARLMKLPSMTGLPRCSHHSLDNGLFITAQTTDDMAFVHSSWNDGIESWRFQLPEGSYQGPVITHTIFDRNLLRAGETVHMKHIIRKHTMTGFSFMNETELPKAVLIRHWGSNQRYEFPLKWDESGIAETEWKIPQEAKLGTYEVILLKKATEKSEDRTAVGRYEEVDESYYYSDGWQSGSLRVEEFRVPLMKASIQLPKEPLVNVSETNVDLQVSYLSGGGAGSTAVKFRWQAQPRCVAFSDFDGFTFANGEVKEEISRRSLGKYDYEEAETEQGRAQKPMLQSSELLLDAAGGMRTGITNIPRVSAPHDIHAELEFKDPNGEIQTVSANIPLWPSKVLVGVKPDAWAMSKESFKFHIAAVDLSGKPVPHASITVELFQRKYYSHRKRLVGGFYSYEHVTETKRIGQICEGKTDAKGLLICDVKSPVSGNVILQSKTKDNAGNESIVHRDVWVAGKDQWWFDVSDSDRIDILPEKKHYEPGETARFQVRMPFREATALITVEREGVIKPIVKHLSGKMPVIEIPVEGRYAPNVFVSVLVVRGRVGNIQPTSLVDLGKPAYKLGIAEINVGWKAHELKVKVSSGRSVYRVREKAQIKIKVLRADGNIPPKGGEIAIAAVDEGLLELMPNKSWDILEAMMGRRGYEVTTATAQMQVVGKRHYGLKALPHGGGGGRQLTREMFDTLLLWKGKALLDDRGEASVEIPLNDSLTSFRIVAVASSGAGLFGTGATSIRTTQDMMLLSGLPPLVREGDRFRAGFTVRNASEKKVDVEISAILTKGAGQEDGLEKIHAFLAPGESKEIGWDVRIPVGVDSMSWEVSAREKDGNRSDRLKVKQAVVAAIPVRTFQATITQVDKPVKMKIEKPVDAPSAKGGINVSLKSKLSNGLGGVSHFMKNYPYTCMEQKVSRAVALRDEELWKKNMAELPTHLDSDGLVKYFPACCKGSDVLTAYILSIANEAGWEIPEHIRQQMENGLKGFIEGKVVRWSRLPTADVSIRKIAALEALSRYGKAETQLLGSINIEPNLWPTSAVIDWMNVLMRVKDIPNNSNKFKEVEQILRSRLNLHGTTMGFSTEGMDNLWWLMVSTDLNAVRTLLTFLNLENWNEDMPRLVRGAIGRQYRGAWNTTIANAWGVLAMEKFSNKFESMPVAGTTSAALEDKTKEVDWLKNPAGESLMFKWPKERADLNISHQGTGRPWATIQSLAAIPLKEPFSSGYKIKKTFAPVEQKQKGKWTSGDVARVRLEIEAQADMTWVVVSDPIPAGASILGTGLGRDSQLLTRGEENKGWVWPAFEERTFETFRAYYEYVPKGSFTVEYTIRLNQSGAFELPETRVEALYSPEMFGEIPNVRFEVGQ